MTDDVVEKFRAMAKDPAAWLPGLIEKYLADSIASSADAKPLEAMTAAEVKAIALQQLITHFFPYEVEVLSIDIENREVHYTVKLPPPIERI
ncbi:hypothetical protein Hden_1204 [Hyphomicrobium denitrificans ATCC 51888]|uniref:Uncharacterized protein n=1 Tax=Hyphomicrobium denitrificans (strain ATCC 51888 / DSM 1869 / NCIMB 11706 / TK 0415) TaxID=582899 RepID=D8JWA3_HYPDA|nr:hypothetical protein [Hyphomicrobium denitrificans]ADJ23016.1 hypothetical protein Hden_1204 [Hyphomicrobium denitrificans ATCC 51888]